MSIKERRIEKAIELYESGMNSAEIGKEIKVSHTTVIRWLRERGIWEEKTITSDRLEEIRRLYVDEHLTCKQVAAKLDYPESKLRSLIVRNGLTRRQLTPEKKKSAKNVRLQNEARAKSVVVPKVDDPIFYVPREPSNKTVTYQKKQYKDVSTFYLGG